MILKLIVIDSYTIVKDKDNDNDDENNTQNNDNERYINKKNRVHVNDHS